MTMFRTGILFFATLAFFAAGCSGPGLRGSMSISLVDFRRTEASELETRGILTVKIVNESISPLGYSGSTHKLYLNGQYVGKGTSDRPFGMPPLSSTTHEIDLTLENPALVRKIMLAPEADSAAYRLESVFFQTVYEDKFQIKVQSEGSLDLRKIRAAQPK